MSGGNYQSERFRINFPLKKYLVLCWPNEQIFGLKWCWWLCHQNLKLATNTVRHQHICSQFWPKNAFCFKIVIFRSKSEIDLCLRRILAGSFLVSGNYCLFGKLTSPGKLITRFYFDNFEIFKKKSEVFILTIFDDFAKFHFLRPHFTTNEIKNNSKILFVPKKWRTLKNWLIYNLPQTAGGCFTFTHFSPTYGF